MPDPVSPILFYRIQQSPQFDIPVRLRNWRVDPHWTGSGKFGILKKFDSPDGSDKSIVIKEFYSIFESKERDRLEQRELYLLRNIQHENLIRLHEIYEVPEHSGKRSIYHITGYCGKPLSHTIEHGRYSMNDAQKWTRELISALQHLHSYGEIHRDLKPSKICIDDNKKLTLLGFGRARVMNRQNNMTTDRGTSYYMPLEQQVELQRDEPQTDDYERGTQPYMPMEELVVWDFKYDQKVDIWSAAVILCEIITGQILFAGKKISNSLKQQIDYCGPVDKRVLAKVKSEMDRRAIEEYSKLRGRQDFIEILRKQLRPGRGIVGSDILENEEPLRSFLEKTLQFNPESRLTAEEALVHPFLAVKMPWEKLDEMSKDDFNKIIQEATEDLSK